METQSELSTLIKEYIHLQDQGELKTIEQMKQSFDSILNKIDENNHLLLDGQLIKELVQFILHSNDKHLCEPDIINHRLFIILRDYYFKLLQRWRHDDKLDEISCFVFETISNLFLKMSSQIFESNASIFKELIFHEPLLNEMNAFLEDISLTGKYLEDPSIKGIDNLFRTIERLERHDHDNKQDKFFENIVKCICSSSFIKLFLQSVTSENENAGERFLFHTLTDYIYSHSIDKQYEKYLIDIQKSLLRPFTHWLSEQSSFFRLWNNRLIIILRQISFILTLNIQLNQLIYFDKKTLDSYYQLIDSFVNILYSIIQSEYSINNKLTQTIIPNLYTMTLSTQLQKYLKTKHITLLIFKFVHFDNDQIRSNAFRILASITTEQDTKDVSYSNNICKIFIEFIEQVIEDSNKTLTFYNLLQCFKHLIQYDQIKDVLMKQNGLELFIRCATEAKFNSFQVQQPALEILLALTFNQEAYQQLKTHVNLIKPFLSSSHQGISRAVETISWKLETEEEALTKSIISDITYKYDIILSFSHADKDLCLRIHDQLIKDDFRVWYDQEETFGTPMCTKGKIIDVCEYIIICTSDAYKQNCYCRCEAHYAFERHCQIIPLIVTSNYRPDGWLTRIISGKIHIDFVKLDFELAYMKLKSEIDRQRKYSKISHKKDSKPVIPITASSVELPTKTSYPSVIDQWTNDDVKAFLISKNLNLLLAAFSEMNGILLHEVYTMCLENRESMFHTLKTEICAINPDIEPLTLLVYLRFLNEIEKYLPSRVFNKN